jgi:hypothetical protein
MDRERRDDRPREEEPGEKRDDRPREEPGEKRGREREELGHHEA